MYTVCNPGILCVTLVWNGCPTIIISIFLKSTGTYSYRAPLGCKSPPHRRSNSEVACTWAPGHPARAVTK